MEKNNSRKEKASETKSKIYKSADELFSEHGFDDVSITDIVEHAGVAKGSFYVHFESKNTLIASIINDYVNMADMDYKACLEAYPEDTSVSEILLVLVGKITEVIADVIGYYNIKSLYKVQITKDVNTHSVLDYNRELYKMFNDVISTGIKQGVFYSEMSADDLTNHYIMALRGLTYEWCVRYPDFDLKEETMKHFRILLKGITNTDSHKK